MSAPAEEWEAHNLPHRQLQPLSRGYIPREEAAWVTSDDWPVFSIHGNFVRPRRDWEWYPGEPCRLRSSASGKMFELPPGSVPYSLNAMGHPATSWDPFVFPNPPRSFLMSQHMAQQVQTDPPNGGIVGIGPGGGEFLQSGRLRHFRRRVKPVELEIARIPPIEMDDLERQLWFDPEPRFEKPFRTYADPKYCTKGARLLKFSELMRPGW